MANVTDRWPIESPKTMIVGESAAFAIDFEDVGTPSAIVSTTAYDFDGTDVTGAVLSGSSTLSGDTVTLAKFTPASAQNYRIVLKVTISQNTEVCPLDIAVFAAAPAIGTITSGSYGSIADVASLAVRHTSKAGSYDDTTTPTGVYVATCLDQVSAILDTMLGASGFATPVTDVEAKRVLDIFANQEVASIIEGINGAGRFGPAVGRGTPKGRWSVIMSDAQDFIKNMAVGLERLGATRTYDLSSGIGYRDTDEAGDSTFPLFERKGFGDHVFQKDWDQ